MYIASLFVDGLAGILLYSGRVDIKGCANIAVFCSPAGPISMMRIIFFLSVVVRLTKPRRDYYNITNWMELIFVVEVLLTEGAPQDLQSLQGCRLPQVHFILSTIYRNPSLT